MRILTAISGLFAVLVSLSAIAGDETFKVTFRVVDAEGRPVTDAELSTSWIIDAKNELKLKGYADSTATSNAEGEAEIAFDDYGWQEIVLLGFSADRRLAGFTVIDRQKEGNTVVIKFTPVATVTATLISSENDSKPWTNTSVRLNNNSVSFFQFRSYDGQFRFPFPEGTWKFSTYGNGVKPKSGEFKTVSGEDYSFGKLDFELTALARLEGKPVPKLEITEARGIDKDFDWADYRGKWVLLEFWGFW